MQYYMAPMEGLTGYIYRNAYHKHYGSVDRYFTPFITNKKLNYKEINDVMPEHNEGIEVVPQILTNRAEDFLLITEELRRYGYERVNLNLGCPSGTVVSKNRGAGFLALPEELDLFLDEIFLNCKLKISIKTRIGKENPKEWEHLLAIYEKYPMEELIVHPRVQKDFYRNTVNLGAFQLAVEQSSHSLCYNGDICNVAEEARVREAFPQLDKIMIGRGILKRPWLVQEICTCGEGGERRELPIRNESEEKLRLRAFHDEILAGYASVMYGDKPTLFKMKELWVYLSESFTNSEKYIKKIKKCERIRDYEICVDALFREQELKVVQKNG